MFALRVDPVIFPEMRDPECREDLRVVVQACLTGQARCTIHEEPHGVWRFRGPLPRSTWANLPARERFLSAIEITARAYLTTLHDELAQLAAEQVAALGAGAA